MGIIHTISKDDFMELVYRQKTNFEESIRRFDVYIVRQFYPASLVQEFRSFLERFRNSQEPSWHPCLDGCPDYHRINDEYPKSYVRAKMHSFYFHRWNEHRDLFGQFKEIFEIKNFLCGAEKDAYYDNIPSKGVISRVVSHQYSRGGGYLTEHLDPTSSFARIQTIIQASNYGEEFKEGGLFYRESPESERVFVDPLTTAGDLVILSPDVRHGVSPIDPNDKLDWLRTDGRWMILPVIIQSDYVTDAALKPKEV